MIRDIVALVCPLVAGVIRAINPVTAVNRCPVLASHRGVTPLLTIAVITVLAKDIVGLAARADTPETDITVCAINSVVTGKCVGGVLAEPTDARIVCAGIKVITFLVSTAHVCACISVFAAQLAWTWVSSNMAEPTDACLGPVTEHAIVTYGIDAAVELLANPHGKELPTQICTGEVISVYTNILSTR